MKLKLNKYIVSYILLLIVFIVPLFLFKPFVDLNYSDYIGYDNAFEDANSIYKMFISIVFILLAAIILNINYLKEIKIKKKLFILNILPLILLILCFILSSISIALDQQSFQKEFFIMNTPCEPTMPCGIAADPKKGICNVIEFVLSYVSIYYIAMLFYGIYYFRKIDNVLGFKIMKFNVSVIIAIFFIFIISILIFL